MADDDKTTTDDNELLTEEERAALDAEEGEEIDGSASLTDEDTQRWRDAGWGGEPAPAEEDTAPSAQGDDTTQAAQGDDTVAAQQGDDTAPSAQQQGDGDKPRQQAPVDTSQYDSEIDGLRQQEQALLDKYDDGDLSRDELREQQAALQEKIDSAVEGRAIARKQLADETEQWNDAVSKYLTDYEGLKSEGVIAAFDAEVRAVTSNPALANRSFKEQLAIAHRRLVSTADDLGLKDVPPIKGQEPAPQPQPQPQQQRATDPRGDDLRTPPKTLARVPASDMSDTGDSKYAALQRVVDTGKPEEVERAMAQLSDEERDIFSSMMV
ncbi:hypothetical protein [Roseovarius nitratireducens]|uniref:hypothetical protein n=1 Tax=Roseovarius nitratireducens TaxID=2044597 RepID=UPI000CE1B369|nr:hypothetical protein [Roseovarius nitratireducens]